MPTEIERKFLIYPDKWNATSKSVGMNLKQGYLTALPDKTIRIRITDNKAYITIKGKTTNISRAEFEYEIPISEAYELLNSMAGNIIEKTRYRIELDNHIWEVDEFKGENEGLILAEIELKSENESFTMPDWVAEEVSQNKRYYNSQLAEHPFKSWKSIDS